MSLYRERLTTFYGKYAPNKLDQVDSQLKKYAGREEDLMSALVQKYGPEPSERRSSIANASAYGGDESYRERLRAFYGKYAPNKLDQVDSQLKKYAGREEDLMSALVQKYGPEPSERRSSIANASAYGGDESYRERLRAFYGKYAPNKLDQVDSQLKKYAGREEDLMSALVQKYGPEPSERRSSIANASAYGGDESYRERLRAFYGKYAPNKLDQVDSQLKKYAGREEDLMSALVQKYGPEPSERRSSIANASAYGGDESYRERLTTFYGKYAPNKLDQVDSQLKKYAGREEDLMSALVQKYGPEPSERRSSIANASAYGGDESYRERLTTFYGKYAPNKLDQVDSQLKKYAGREEDLMSALVQKYGPEPSERRSSIANASAYGGDESYRERLRAFYGKYAPNKLDQVDSQLKKYAGREEDLMSALVQKYGPEPSERRSSIANASAYGGDESYRERLTTFYGKYAPNKLDQVDSQLKKYAGREEDLMSALVQKYGPEPSERRSSIANASAYGGVGEAAENKDGVAAPTFVKDSHRSADSAALEGGQRASNALSKEGDIIATHIHDEEEQRLLRDIAADLDVEVRNRDMLVALSALLEARSSLEVLGTLPHGGEMQAYCTLNESMYLPSTPQLALTTQTRTITSYYVSKLSEMLLALEDEEATRRISLELLEADDVDILLAEEHRSAHIVAREKNIFAIRAAAEALLLHRVWRVWHDTTVERKKRAKRDRLQRWTPYQKMLFGKSVSAYYERLARSQRCRQQRDHQMNAETAKSNEARRRRLRKNVAEHGNIVNRNIFAVLLGEELDELPDGNTMTTPEESPSPEPVSGNTQRQKSRSQHFSRSPHWHVDTVVNNNASKSSFYNYGSRVARLNAIEQDFDCLPPNVRARVIRTLKKWDTFPASPPRPVVRDVMYRHNSQERHEQMSRRLDTLNAFSGIEDDRMIPQWCENDAELRKYLAGVLIDAFDAEEAELLR